MSRRVVSFIIRIERLSKDNNLGGNAESFRPIYRFWARWDFFIGTNRVHVKKKRCTRKVRRFMKSIDSRAALCSAGGESQSHEYFAAVRHIESAGKGHISRGGKRNVRFEICERKS